MPVILAIWEAEIWRIVVWGQPKNTLRRCQLNQGPCVCHPS
jgi:hypothetical protein